MTILWMALSTLFVHEFGVSITAQKRYSGIHDAVRNGDVLELESMVKNGASINEVEDADKFTPLHTACNSGALEVSSFYRITSKK